MFFFNKPKDKKEYYFGLFLKGDEVTGFVFEVSKDHFSVLVHQTSAYTNGWENIMQDVDETLTKLETMTRLHLKKVIFFLYSYFVDDTTAEIRQPYKNIIKTISKELELQPLGYIECNEAVAQYLERRDKSPLNVILVEIDKKNVDICIYKGSRKVISKTISRTTNLVDDLTTIFSEVKTQTLLPSRLVLYDSTDLDDESVNILGHKWDKDIFIQHPRVEVIKRQDLYTELGTIFAAQLRKEGSKVPVAAPSESIVQTQKEPLKEESVQNVAPVSSLPEDIVITSPQKDIMGFMIHSDDDTVMQSGFSAPVTVSATKSSLKFTKPTPPFKISLPQLRIPTLKVNFVRSAFIVGLLLIIASLFFIEYRFHKATLVILLPSKMVTKHMDITNLDIKTASASSTVEGSAQTTGKRDIGEKAHGEVTMHNFKDSVKIFPKGTTIEVDSHSFSLDQDISVASASETLSDGGFVKQPGKAKVAVTASAIGLEGNLEKGKRFKIGTESISDYFAVNEAAFSGGTKKSIRTVAKKDIDDLKKVLLDKGKKQAIENSKKELPAGSRLLETLTEASLKSSKATKEVGEESDQVGLTVQVVAPYYYFNEEELKNYLASTLNTKIPSDFEMDTKRLSYAISKVEKSDKRIKLAVEATESATKKISAVEIASAVKGKRKNSLEQIVKNKADAEGYRIDISAPVPFLDTFMPFNEKNITVKTTSE